MLEILYKLHILERPIVGSSLSREAHIEIIDGNKGFLKHSL